MVELWEERETGVSAKTDRRCQACDGPLPGGKRKWCSERSSDRRGAGKSLGG
jgi:hypothetical protein